MEEAAELGDGGGGGTEVVELVDQWNVNLGVRRNRRRAKGGRKKELGRSVP